MRTPASENKQIWAWALYDWANSAFATTILVAFFPLFFARYWGAGLDDQTSTFWLGVGSAVAGLVVAVFSPPLGAVGDAGAKKPLLALMTGLGVAFSAALFFVPAGGWAMALLCFGIAQVGFSLGITFYDALIVDVASPSRRNQVSALGYALGYLGGGLLLAVNVLMTLKPGLFGLADASAAVRWSFLSVAVWWGVFSLPLFRVVSEDAPPRQSGWGQAALDGFADVWRTLQSLRAYPHVLLFLFAYWLYIDGVHTIARMAVDYGVKLGFDPNALIKALLLTQFIGFPATIVFGRLAKPLGAKRALYIAIGVYVGVTLWGYTLQTEAQFYAMAAIIGLVQGATQALSRSYFSLLIPADKSGQFFGFYNMMGKFAAVLGPALVGVSAVLTGSSRLAILSILVLLVGGLVALMFVRDPQAGRASSGQAVA